MAIGWGAETFLGGEVMVHGWRPRLIDGVAAAAPISPTRSPLQINSEYVLLDCSAILVCSVNREHPVMSSVRKGTKEHVPGT